MSAPAAYLGVDAGTENVRVSVAERRDGRLIIVRRAAAAHGGRLRGGLDRLLGAMPLSAFAGAAASGRRAGALRLAGVPEPRALAEGFAAAHPDVARATLVNIGSRGFGVLELRSARDHVYRRNNRCSQGTGSFLTQLTGRLGLRPEEADALCAGVAHPAALSGRCPVILKTDMTHLANRGEPREAILAGLFDAVAENVEALIRRDTAPPDVYLCGGVSRSLRLRAHMRRFLEARGMRLRGEPGEASLFYQSDGAALEAARLGLPLPGGETIYAADSAGSFERIKPPRAALALVRTGEGARGTAGARVIVGLDIGSTGAKALALDAAQRRPVWRRYVPTAGDPAGAAGGLVRAFLEGIGAGVAVHGVGVTGSGREIVGSMLRACVAPERVRVINEIVAHAAGALHYDPGVDTIFEIGGQDAKYVRLQDGEVCEAALNEACSAGTGSFIEEQGRRVAGLRGADELAAEALRAESAVSFGQHCSVFMAEIIEEALGSGVPREAVAAGIYDSVVLNFLNRVKGARPIGRKVFCQGMPFASPALAAAVAGRIGREVIVPPEPGFTGALGVALLARKELGATGDGLDLRAFGAARLVARDTFVCRSRRGCGGAGNRCRIDRLRVSVAGRERRYVWGGSCALFARGSGTRALPDMTPDPVRERREAARALAAGLSAPRGRPVIGLSDEFALKGLFPFFATFLHALGFDLCVPGRAGREALKRGIEELHAPLCAPMQLFAGALAGLREQRPAHLFVPMLVDLPRAEGAATSTACPLSQASADLLAAGAGAAAGARLHAPVIRMGPGNLRSALFRGSVEGVARDFGVRGRAVREAAYARALDAQERFDAELSDRGRAALEFAARRGMIAVVLLGRPYTLHNDVLNSSVPRLLRELGALAVPVDAYPVGADVPPDSALYWGYGQANARAAREVRRTPGHYAVFCSNYSCGPDSFDLHLVTRIMRGKPFAVIETDGHSGDAGTKTRLEAFLHCAEAHHRAETSGRRRAAAAAARPAAAATLDEVRASGETLLIPRMGENAEVLAACLRADGYRCEALPLPDRDALALGRACTSGKECLPAVVTLGSLLQRLERGAGGERLAFLMPTASGPCRFGMYSLLHRMILGESRHGARVRVVSPHSADYFAGISRGLAVKAFAAFFACDVLYDALLDARPAERAPGAAQAVYDRWYRRLLAGLERAPSPPAGKALGQALNGVFGLGGLLRAAAADFAAARDAARDLPGVALVGEIYVRLDPFANDEVVRGLERRGVRVRLAPFHEWIDYVQWLNSAGPDRRPARPARGRAAGALARLMRDRIEDRLYGAAAGPLSWPRRATALDAVRAAEGLLRRELAGEAILTLGFALHEFLRGRVHGAVNVGPLECMPGRVAEAQFVRAGERHGLPVTTVFLNGDAMDSAPLDDLVYRVQRSFRLSGVAADR
ncbi:MAG: CoA activase [Lentisphaerae bacterium]|nr:CoA activase [Lentisphaerota bacterium]